MKAVRKSGVEVQPGERIITLNGVLGVYTFIGAQQVATTDSDGRVYAADDNKGILYSFPARRFDLKVIE